MRLFSPLYEKAMRWARHPRAPWYLGGLSFAESSFFPIPVDVMLAPMCLADRDRWVRYALIATLASVAGGLAGYAIGYAAFEAIEPWLRESHYWSAYETSRRWFDEYGVVVVFVAGFSPIPYKVFTIAAGVAALSVPGFLLASLVGRAARFFLVAGLVRAGGERFESGLARHIERIGWVVVALSVGLIAWLMMRGQ